MLFGDKMMAEGLCIQPLLQHGIPGPEALDSLMKEIDDQLLQNQQQYVKGLSTCTFNACNN